VRSRPLDEAGFAFGRAAGKVTSDEYRQMMEPIYAALERGEKLKPISSSPTISTGLT
jgi:hypothetical protein